MGITYVMPFSSFLTIHPSPRAAQAAASQLTTCRLAASHTPVQRGRHAPMTAFPNS